MRAAWLTLAFYATAAGSLSISREELFREIFRQLSPKHHKNAIGHGPVLYDYEDYFDAPDFEEPLCVAELVLAEDRRATCRPRNQLVPLPPGPPELLRFPRLVELKRCEGACDHAGRQCWPTVKNSVNIKVVRVNVTGGKTQVQCAEEIMEEHAKCSCKCPVKKLPLQPKPGVQGIGMRMPLSRPTKAAPVRSNGSNLGPRTVHVCLPGRRAGLLHGLPLQQTRVQMHSC
nr:vascular endothelial growth factor B-like [Rhipicephalus microplus]